MSKLCQKFEQASSLIGKRWVNMIVYELLTGPKRFNQLLDQLEISAKMLSERLKFLEDNEILIRRVYDETPIRIEYELTDKGHSLRSIVEALTTWSQTWY
jgi:DNA-binding HxlR family transcriptional regulator